MRITAYCRVSTTKQGESGLGIEAQREAIRAYATANAAEIIGEYIEVCEDKFVFSSASRLDAPA